MDHKKPVCKKANQVRHRSFRIWLLLLPILLSSCAGLFINKGQAPYQEGLAHFNQGRFSEAIPYFQEAVRLDSGFYEGRLYLGRSYLNLHDERSAIPELKKAFRLSPREFQKEIADLIIDALLGQAAAELQAGNLQESMQYIREVLSTDPKSQRIKEDVSKILSAMALHLYGSGKAKDAIREFTEAIKLNPNNLDAYVGLVRALLKNGELVKALETAQKAVSLDPNSKEVLNTIENLLKRKDQD